MRKSIYWFFSTYLLGTSLLPYGFIVSLIFIILESMMKFSHFILLSALISGWVYDHVISSDMISDYEAVTSFRANAIDAAIDAATR